MFKIYKIIILLFFLSFPLSVNAHVLHYADLNRIEFDIYRNNKHIGTHIFSFKKSEGQLAIESEINFEIKKLGIVLYSCLLYTSPSPRDQRGSRMPSSA